MKRRFRIYYPFVNAGMQQVTTYRVDWIFYLLGNVVHSLVSFFIWQAVFLSGSEETLNGFTMPQMIVYFFLIFISDTMITSDASMMIAEEVRDGSIAMRMLRPVGYNATFLFFELGGKLLTQIVLIVPVVIGVEISRFVLSGVVQLSVLNLLLFFVSTILAYLINLFFSICFGFLAFVIKHIWGTNIMKNCIVSFCSGAMVPLSFMPDALKTVFMLLPFASLNYTPVMIYMGVYQGADLLCYFGLQIFWALFFWALSKVLAMVSAKHLTVQGG